MQVYHVLDDRERATILAALEVYRDSGLAGWDNIVDIATAGYTLERLAPGEQVSLADRIKECRSEQVQPIAEAYRDYAAANLTSDGEIEIDADALVSMGEDPGAYVMAWVWVDNSDLPEAFRITEEQEATDA